METKLTNNKIGYISRLEIVINGIENIAQNQSFVQKRIGAKKKVPILSTPYQNQPFLDIGSFYPYYIDNKLHYFYIKTP